MCVTLVDVQAERKRPSQREVGGAVHHGRVDELELHARLQPGDGGHPGPRTHLEHFAAVFEKLLLLFYITMDREESGSENKNGIAFYIGKKRSLIV